MTDKTGKKDVFVLAIPNLPNPITHPKKAKKVAEALRNLEGLVSVTPYYPHGTILSFESYNAAKTARNIFRAEGNKVGNYIMDAVLDYDGNHLTIMKPTEGEK